MRRNVSMIGLVVHREIMRIALISCAKMKRRGIHPARDLYTSPLFRKALTYAEGTCEKIFILSAKYGLLSAGQRIRSYDKTLLSMSAEERKAWAKQVLRQLKSRLKKNDELWFFCGTAYREHLIPLLRSTHHVSVPLHGLSIGGQLHWYNKHTHK